MLCTLKNDHTTFIQILPTYRTYSVSLINSNDIVIILKSYKIRTLIFKNHSDYKKYLIEAQIAFILI